MPRSPRLFGRSAIAVLVSAGVAAFALQASGGRASAAATDPFLSLTGNVQLTSDVLYGIDKLTPNSPYNPAQTIELGLALSRPDVAGENAYIADVYNSKSPNFRQFLDPASFQTRFGVSTNRYQALISWLTTAGLTTTPVAGSTEYVLAQGPAAIVEALFQTPVNNYTFDSRTFYANTVAPTVPASLGILTVAGLQTYAHMFTDQQLHAMAIARGTKFAAPQAPAAGPQNTGSTTPQDLWSIYQQPDSNRGAGESMAIFGWGATESNGVDVIGNLRTFETTYHLPMMPIQISNYGSPPFDTNGTGEWELDLPASTGMAPDASFEHLYFGVNGQDPDMLAALAGWNQDANGPRQGSASFAGCEASPLTGSQPGAPGNPPGNVIIGNPNQDAWEAGLKQSVMLGRTLFNSAGDLGPNGCPAVALVLNGVTLVPVQLNDYPSVSTWVTTVGGTVLYWNGDGNTGPGAATRYLEYSWSHTGGGTSDYVSSAAWQNGAFATNLQSAPGLTQPCVADWHNPPNTYAPGTLCRGLPDVASQSGDVLTNGYVAGGGTSLSAPLWLGMWTRIQAASSNPGRLGFASPAIYANNADATKYARDFFDIGNSAAAALNSDGAPSTIPNCYSITLFNSCSKPGWDYLSGWGTPNVKNLMADLTGNTSPVPFAGIPEAPSVGLLALGGIGVVAVAGLVRRHRRRGLIVSS